MQSIVNFTDQDVPVLHGGDHNRSSGTCVIRKTIDADNTEERCYLCLKNWQIGDGIVRLQCCNQWIYEDCLSKSMLHGHCPTCGSMPFPYNTLKPQGPASICGEGGYATVSLYLPNEAFVLKGTEVWVDGKCFSRRLSRLSIASLVREDAVYKRLGSHPLILNYSGKVLVHRDVYSLKIERALGCLREFVLSCPAPSRETRLAMAVQAAASISHVHSKNVIHADVSTRNLFVFDNWQLKLGDFGGSRIDDQGALVAEEAFYQLPRYGRTWRELDETKRELFALGCGIYEITAWKTLYAELPSKEQAVARHHKGEFPDTRDLIAGDVIYKCWHEKYNAAADVEKDLRNELMDFIGDM